MCETHLQQTKCEHSFARLHRHQRKEHNRRNAEIVNTHHRENAGIENAQHERMLELRTRGWHSASFFESKNLMEKSASSDAACVINLHVAKRNVSANYSKNTRHTMKIMKLVILISSFIVCAAPLRQYTFFSTHVGCLVTVPIMGAHTNGIASELGCRVYAVFLVTDFCLPSVSHLIKSHRGVLP